MNFFEPLSTHIDKFPRSVVIEESPHGERNGDVMNHWRPSQQAGSLHRNGSGTSKHIVGVLSGGQHQTVSELLHQCERIALIGARRAQSDAVGLAPHNLSGAISHP
jgi:hypothetical protein